MLMPTPAAIAARQLLLSFPDSPAFVPFPAACKFIGIARQTGDHWLAQGKFPVPTIRLGTRKLGVPMAALQYWLEDALKCAGVGATEAPAAINPVSANPSKGLDKKGRGRPRKMVSGVGE